MTPTPLAAKMETMAESETLVELHSVPRSSMGHLAKKSHGKGRPENGGYSTVNERTEAVQETSL